MADETAAKSEATDEARLGWRVLNFDYLRKPHDLFASVVYAFAFFLLCAFVYFALAILYRVVGLATSGTALEINQLLLALAGIIGAPFVVWRVLIAAKANTIAQDSAAEKARIDIQNLQSTLLTKAVEQLGAMREEKKTVEETGEDGKIKRETITNTVPNTEVRLGAIYALEKLARDSEELHWPIMEILCAYVRKNAGPARPRTRAVATAYAVYEENRNEQHKLIIAEHEANNIKPPFVDVQAALTVIGRRPKSRREYEKVKRDEGINGQDYRLDLSQTHLVEAWLEGLHFEHADFVGSSLERARLKGIHLEYAEMSWTHLEDADLSGSFLSMSNLVAAFLFEANLGNAHM